MLSKILRLKYLYISIIAAVIGVYVYFLVRYSVNVPYADDFYAIYEWFLKLDMLSHGWDRFLHFFSLHNEHRIVRNHIVQYIVYIFSDSINIKTIIYIGNSALLFILLFFWKATKGKYKLLLLTITTLLLINLRYAESSFFAMAALSNIWVIVFALWAIYFATNKSVKITDNILSLCFAIIALGTQGNGVLIFPTLIIIYFLMNKKKYMRNTILVFVIFLGLYFVGYHGPEGLGSPFDNILVFLNTPKLRLFPFAFLGNVFGAPYYYFTGFFDLYNIPYFVSYLPAILVGCLLTIYYLYLFLKKNYFKINPLVSSVIIFIFLNAALVTITRITIGYDGAVTSRYALYGIILLSCFIISFYQIRGNDFKKINIRIINISLFIVSVLINILFNYVTYKVRLKPNSIQRVEAMDFYHKEGYYPGIVPNNIDEDKKIEIYNSWKPWYSKYTKILDESIFKGYYKLDK